MADDKASKRTARKIRIFHDGDITTHAELALDKKASHHLTTVLRATTNDRVVLFNGDGNEYAATLVNTGQRGSGKRAVLHINECAEGISESPVAITLAQCVSRAERMDISLRQAVELGVTAIQPLFSRHSAKPGDDARRLKKHQHWQSIIISASEQSGRSVLPKVHDAQGYGAWVQQCVSENALCYVLSPRASQSLPEHAASLTGHGTGIAEPLAITLVIGPESGLDEDEIEQAVAAGAVPVHLGQRILRTETAGPACVVLLQALLGDLQA